MRIGCPKTTIGICAVTIHVVCAVPALAWAEGGDRRSGSDYGINRRVRSKDGYVAASGTFSPSFNLPPFNSDILSSPSFYLGGNGKDYSGDKLEVDAGLQFDQNPPENLPVGWTAIISVNRKQMNPRIWTPSGWRAWRGGADSEYYLKYVVEGDGTLRLEVSGLGTFYWIMPAQDVKDDQGNPGHNGRPDNVPSGMVNDDGVTIHHTGGHDTWPWTGEAVMNSADFDSQTVKRVIAITQGGTWTGDLDGTVFTCTFSGGALFPYYNRAETGWTKDSTAQGGTILPPGSAAVQDPTDFTATGYDAVQKLSDPRAWDAQVAHKPGPYS